MMPLGLDNLVLIDDEVIFNIFVFCTNVMFKITLKNEPDIRFNLRPGGRLLRSVREEAGG